MKTLFLSSLSKAMNAYLSLDPESKNRLRHLQNKIITIELRPFHFIFQCEFSAEGVTLHADDILPAETKLTGTPLQMLGVMMTKENRNHFFSDDLMMEGNAEFGQQIVELFDELHIDWEEQLSHFTGDTSAHHISRFVRNVTGWLQQVDQHLSQDMNEYIHEEAEWLPHTEALQDFFNDIDTLRMDVDRAEAKINHLLAENMGNVK